jgi:photosystem II stability/assembly factor-like uncharacterized protein
MSNNRFTLSFLLLLITFLSAESTFAQKQKADLRTDDTTFTGIKWRSIGPAFMSGRIADIAMHPTDYSQWYVAVGSGGVWKTQNAGTTWTPLFDKQKSYSIGCITIDPNNPNVIWVGTGENVGGRHVGYGDGLYRSTDGGESWKNMGLKESQHISRILIHPDNSNIIWVAVQGPLWNSGGERGLYKTVDGGKTWNKKLGDDENTGVTEVAIDPRNPNILYAATWERYRNVAVYQGSGPGSGLHKSDDGGETWTKLTKGLPGGNLGKIGLAISPQKPDVIYAAIELERRTGAVYRTENRGASWTKMSEAVSGATGPHYYQELYACPHNFDRIYLVDVRMQISDDGGKTFRRMEEKFKHSDNHAIVFRSDDPDYLLVGTDGGIYESFDLAKNWRFIENLPLTQFYKVALDDTEPFYNIYGGTQDNNTQGGPSRTPYRHGIRNADWFVTLGGDGHQPATEPGNPNIIYSESQQGNLHRIDRKSGDIVYIKPQPDKGDDYERYNWDAPILVSPHMPSRLYFASQRLWRSDDRGDSWTAISDDLTRDQDRLTLPIREKTWSWDASWDLYAMSTYNTITSISESPIQEGLIYIGTDDGLIQVTQDGGKNWKKIEVGSLPGVPSTAFVNDIKADLHDNNKVYVVLDNHKFGDLEPYLLKSSDKGKSWKSIKNNLPTRTLLWRIVQDHEMENLMFLGTEFGVYFTNDGGKSWNSLKGGMPTIPVRDLAIQKRENDLVAATFGRGFYVLDDYSFLREVEKESLKEGVHLYASRKSWWYIPKAAVSFGYGKGAGGASYFTAPNPPFGTTFTYQVAESFKSSKDLRKEKEQKLKKENKEVEFPGWEKLEQERRDEVPELWLIIRDSNDKVVQKINTPSGKGFHRTTWDLRYPGTSTVKEKEFDTKKQPRGIRAIPGTYSATLEKNENGQSMVLSGPVKFKVEQLFESTLNNAEPEIAQAFWKDCDDFQKSLNAAKIVLSKSMNRTKAMKVALSRAPIKPGELEIKLFQLMQDLYDIENKIYGDAAKRKVGEKTGPTIQQRLSAAQSGYRLSNYGPTPNLKKTLAIAKEEFEEIKSSLKDISESRIPNLEADLLDAGAPWIEGQKLPVDND